MKALDFVPAIDRSYVPSATHGDIEFYLKCGENVAVLGEKASGKTTMVEQICAQNGYPLFQQSGSDDVVSGDARGAILMRDGATVWIDGPAVLAAKYGGIYMLDEGTSADQSVMSSLFSLLDSRRMLYIPETGETVKAKKGFRAVYAGNIRGAHVRGSLMDATRSRFQVVIMDDHSHVSEVLCSRFVKGVKKDTLSGQTRGSLKGCLKALMADVERLRGNFDPRDIKRASKYYAAGNKGEGHMTVHRALELAMTGVSDDPEARDACMKALAIRIGTGKADNEGGE